MSNVRPFNSRCTWIVRRASLTLPSCSPNYPRTSRIGWTHARHCPFLNCVCICIWYITMIMLKYFGADLQRRNDKFDLTILLNLRLPVLDLGRGFQCWIHVEKGSFKKKFSIEKKKKGKKGTRMHSILVTDHFLRVWKGYHSTRAFLS